MAKTLTLKCSGLYTNPNTLGSVPEGSLVRADNIVLDRDDLAEPRRGFGLYGSAMSSAGTRAKQLLNYQGKLLRHFTTTLQYDDGSGTFTSYTSSVTEPETGVKLKGVEMNNNFYFTSSSGIRKLDSITGSTITPGDHTTAGVPAALDLTLSLIPGSFLPDTSAVAYRVIFGYRDVNNNLLLGAPSERTIIASGGSSTGVRVQATIPAGINDKHFYQVYRTLFVDVLADPGDECALVYEKEVTSTDISNGYVIFDDDTPDSFRGEPLYTSPSQEGITQANNPPPFALDLCTYKNMLMLANTKTLHTKQLALISTNNLIGNTITFDNGTVDFTLTFATNGDKTGNLNSGSPIITSLPSTTGLLAGQLVTGPHIPVNTFILNVDSATQITLTNNVTGSGSHTLTFGNGVADGIVAVSTNPSVAISIEETARNITAVTNGYSANTIIYGRYASGVNAVPGIIIFQNRTLNDPAFFITVNTSTISGNFTPTLPTSGSTVISENEEVANRVYYSKLAEPEAVPLINFFDLGGRSYPIRRIIALRGSVFVLKDDGVFRIVGEDPTSLSASLFDGTLKLVAPESAVVSDNVIYCLCEQGVAAISDTGATIISEPIKNELQAVFPVTDAESTALRNTCFGVAYDTDYKYLLAIISQKTDTVATQVFILNTVTKRWTDWETANGTTFTKTCGVVNTGDGKLYWGAGDTNYLEQERKNYTYSDYADRSISTSITGIDGKDITLTSVSSFEVGDILSQTEYLSIYEFNQLLAKLDSDSGIADSTYYSTLAVSTKSELFTRFNGTNNPATNLLSKLDADLGPTDNDYFSLLNIGSSTSGTDLRDAFNDLADKLNADPNVGFNNYEHADDSTDLITLITAIDAPSSTITINIEADYLLGAALVYKAIIAELQWTPIHAGDPSQIKQFAEAIYMFTDYSFEGGTVSFSSDIQPNFDEIDFTAATTGTWGWAPWGEFSWGGDNIPRIFRTYVPRGKQRCALLNPTFKHIYGYEKFALAGLSLTVLSGSTRVNR
jgi:hypothetical protein